MNEIIQLVGIVMLTAFVFKFKSLRYLYFAILLLTNYFGFVDTEDFKISGLNLIHYFTIMICILGIVLNQSKRRSINVRHNNYYLLYILVYLFFAIQTISYFFTVVRGYSALESLLPYLDFVSYILIFPLLIPFRNADEKEFYFFIETIYKFTFLNLILYVLNSIGIMSFYKMESFSYIEGYNDVSRTLMGFPTYLTLIFPMIYIRFRNKFTLFNLIFLSLVPLSLILAATRSLIIVFGISAILIELYYLRQGSVLKTSRIVVTSIILLVFLSLVFAKNIEALSSRFNEANKISEMNNVNYRFLVAEERIQLTLEESPIFGLGFIYKNDAHKLGFKIDNSRLIHPDIFWPNLFSTTGLLGSIVFVVFLFSLILLFRKMRDNLYCHAIYLHLLSLFFLTFSSGGSLFKGSLAFAIIIGWGLVALHRFSKPIL